MHTLSIKIDDNQNSLNSENGISINVLGNYLISLYGLIDTKNANCTLKKVRGNCYAVDLSTKEVEHKNNFEKTYKNIFNKPYDLLDAKEKRHVNVLNTITKTNFTIEAFVDGTSIAKIKTIPTSTQNKFYYIEQTICGLPVKVGGESLESKSTIKIEGFNRQINVPESMDFEILQYYKKNKIAAKVRFKKSMQDHSIKSCELISYRILDTKSILEFFDTPPEIPIPELNKDNNLDDLLNLLYDYDNQIPS